MRYGKLALMWFLVLVGGAVAAATANMALDLPVVGSTAGPTYATMVNTAFSTVDAHDHTSGKGVQVPSAGIGINAALEFNDNHITEVKSLRFQNQASPLGTGSDLRNLYVSGGNLYYNNASGTQIQITDATGLNASVLGGFGGDYTSAAASAIYTSATTLYTFRQPDTSDAHIQAANATLSGDLAVNGDDITSDGSTLTINAGGTVAIQDNVTVTGDLAVNGDDITSDSALVLTPASGSSLSVVLATTGDFIVNTDDLYVDTSSGFVGVNDATPSVALDVTGTIRAAASGPGVLRLSDTDAGAGFKNYRIQSDGDGSNGIFAILHENDALSNDNTLFEYNVGSDVMNLYNGDITISGTDTAVRVSGASSAILRLTDAGAGTNFKNYRIQSDGDGSTGHFYILHETDALGNDYTVLGHDSNAGATTLGNDVVEVTSGQVEVAGNVVPETTNTRSVGTTSARFATAWMGQGIFTDTDESPDDQTELAARNAHNNVLAKVYASCTDGGTPQCTYNTPAWNITSVTRISNGRATVELAQNVETGTSFVCSPSTGATLAFCTIDIIDKNTVDVYTFNSAGAATSMAWSLVGVGSPDTLP